MTFGIRTSRWCVCTCWTFDDSLSGYDDGEVISTHATREEAQSECDRLYRNRQYLHRVDVEKGSWCIGLGIGAELAAPYATLPESEPHAELYWADYVPDEFIQLKEAQE